MTYNTFPTLQGLGWPVNITPTFRTHIETTRAGAQFRSQMWPATLHTFEIVFNYLSANDYETLKAFYAGQLGGWMPFWFSPGAFIANSIPFGAWNGVDTSAQLVDSAGNPISSASVSAIHRTDWEGRQLLYPTPRTNFFGGVIGASGWPSETNCTNTPNAALGPDGVTSNAAQIVVTSAGSGGTYGFCSEYSAPAGTLNTHSLWLKGAAGGESVQLKDPSITNTIVTFTLTNAWVRYFFNDTAQTAGAGLWIVPAASTTIYAADGQVEVGGAPTSWINNPNYNSSPVTLTDYTLSGTTVNLAQAPVSTATTDWSGTGSVDNPYLCVFPAEITYEQFVNNLYKAKKVILQEVR